MSNDVSGAPGIVTHPNEPNVSSAAAKLGAASNVAAARAARKPFLIASLPLYHLTQDTSRQETCWLKPWKLSRGFCYIVTMPSPLSSHRVYRSQPVIPQR